MGPKQSQLKNLILCRMWKARGPCQPRLIPTQLRQQSQKKFFDQGLKLYEQYNYQEALANFDKAIAANPANFKVYTAKGITLCLEGGYRDGMALIQKTLDMNPGYVPAFYDMAMGVQTAK